MQRTGSQRRREGQGEAAIRLGTSSLVADPSGALWHAAERLLIVADLHLEKGSAFAARRVFLPPYDTAATLARLAAVIAFYAPRTLVALGDSFHDPRAGQRMDGTDRAALASLQVGRDWIWIAGNHDPQVPDGLGETVAELRVGDLVLRHEPGGEGAAEIAGHLHPVARVVTARGSVRRRCFVSDGRRCIMPAFGAYAGGLNIRDRAFAALLGARRLAHVLGRDAVYPIDLARCAGD